MKLIKKEYIFTDNAAAPSCHASTILKLEDGSLVSAWFAGEREGAANVSIWYSKCTNGVWSRPEMIPRAEELPHWNPVLFKKNDGTVCLFYKISSYISNWKTMIVTSRDGENWSKPEELIEGDESGGRGPVKNKPIYASNGMIIAPSSSENGAWTPFVDIFCDGLGWQKVFIPRDDEVGLIQPTLWESEQGHISALMRSNCGRIYRSDSADYGKSWCRAYPTEMPNNNSGIDCVRLDDGRIVLVCNPVEVNWGKRSPLSVFVSADNGESFEREMDLETEEGEFSYPAIIADGDRIYVTYTWKRERIAFCEILVK